MLQINISSKDHLHLKKLAVLCDTKLHFITNNGGYGISKQVKICITDKYLLNNFFKKYDLKKNKTINAPKIKILCNLTNCELMAFIIGFIDGDGSICIYPKRNGILIRVLNHKNWSKVHKLFIKTLINKFGGKIGYNKTLKYSSFYITNSKTCLLIRKFAKRYKLPILNRKWDKLDYFI